MLIHAPSAIEAGSLCLLVSFLLGTLGGDRKVKKIRKTGVPVELLLLAGKHTGGTPVPGSNYCHLQVLIVCHHQTLA